MPELLRKRSMVQSRRLWLLGWALSAVTAAGFAATDPIPSSVRACAAEADPGKRLSCYDREMARFPEPTSVKRSTSAVGSASSPAPAATSAPPATPSQAQTTAAPASSAPNKDARHISAHVTGIDRSPNEVVLHLDNGQVWEQVQIVSGDLSLQVGDTVKIDRQLGSYWLSGPHLSGMKVVQKK